MQNKKLPLVRPDDSIRKAISTIDRIAKGIALVVDGNGVLIGTITDGDIRRAVLADVGMDSPISELLALKPSSPYPKPITAQQGVEDSALIGLMEKHVIRQIPLLDMSGRVVDLAVIDDLLPKPYLPLRAMVMAGGRGTRLMPLTLATPKPMLPVGGRPLMELTIERLRQAGVRHISISTHYYSEKIIEYFGSGKAHGVQLDYVIEESPLGTAGALGMVEKPSEPVLVINGDILTQLNIRAMLDYHREHRADITVAVRKYDMQVPYGVVDCDGPSVRRLREKPQLSFFVNAGIYLLDSSVLQFIPYKVRMDMPELIQKVIELNKSVVSFPVVEYWLDIGHHENYEQAQKDRNEDGALN